MMRRRVKGADKQHWHDRLTWLKPGMGVKRWLMLLALGVGFLSLGGALALRSLYPLPPYFYYLTLQFLPRGIRAGLILSLGIGMLGFGLWELNHTILEPFLSRTNQALPDVLYAYRQRGRGPNVVIIGGGHGQATILRGLKAYSSNVSAIVTVADDGGSSGRLRRDMGILPPGDFRNCIAALADDESLMTRLFQYRFASGEDLKGHSFGNLFISAMAGITGSFESALRESSHVLAVQGRVLPSTLEAVTLCADIQREDSGLVRVEGESEIPKTKGIIVNVTLKPEAPAAYPGAVQAILDADIVVIGPGSLYTSLLPNLTVPGIAEALRSTRAVKIYVCNVATEPGETTNYTAEDHVAALESHLGPCFCDRVLVNTAHSAGSLPTHLMWVRPELKNRPGVQIVKADLISDAKPWQHDSEKLAEAVINLRR
jgi:uncharacterized cofD-like protein